MSLSPGTRLGPYEIVAPLGAGGMGEVYRAKDARLGREVAVKVLPSEVASDPERLRRFEQEARATSALNHPNLLTLYDLGTASGAPYLVAELLAGSTLRERLATGEAIALRDAVDWGAQIARGLAAAHEKGIVHRDLKPENLFVTRDGRVKILDFGLARLTLGDEGSLANATTLAGGATASGVILGTAGYMAPEQVRGERVGPRADLFSLGCVLYELLGGRRAFHGESAIESLNAILREEPPALSTARPDLPPGLVRVVERCLEKSAERRFHDATDLAWALESAAAAGSGATSRAADRPPRRRMARLAVALPSAVALAALTMLLLTRGREEGAARNAAGWRGERLIGGALIAYGPRPSPDGSLVAFMTLDDGGQSQVAVLRPGESRFTFLTRNRERGPITMINWSADGRTIYFNRAMTGAIYSVPLLGGEERLVVEHANRPVPLPDGSLLALRGISDGVYRLLLLSSDRTRAEPVGPEFVELPAPGPEGTLAAFPDGHEALHYGLRKEDLGRRGPGLWAIDLASGAARELAPGLDFPRAGDQVAPPAVAVDPTTDEALVVVERQDLYVVMSVPRTGSRPPQALLHLTAPPFFLAVGRDGAIYADPVEVFGSLVKVDPGSGDVRRLARFTGMPGVSTPPLELPDGGVLFSGIDGGIGRLLVARPGHAAAPFSELSEESSGPACLIDPGHVAFFVGPVARREIAIATLDGRLVRRAPLPGPGAPDAFGAWGDGKSVLYGLAGRLLVLDTSNGAHRELAAAETGAVDPRSGELVVVPKRPVSDVRSAAYSAFVRLGRDGAPRESYDVEAGGYPEAWGEAALDARGRLVLSLGASDTWWIVPGWIDLAARRLHRVPSTIDGDLFSPSWARDGSILAIAWEYSVNSWRFSRDDAPGPRP